jgi:hypothetical protein
MRPEVRMGLADGIRKHGFCAWHERALLVSFGWLALLLVSGVAAFGALEGLFNARGWGDAALSALVIAGSGAFGIVSLHRFLSGLVRAMIASSQAMCSECEAFGRLAVIAADQADTWVRVRCRGCTHEWLIDLARKEDGGTGSDQPRSK